MKEFWKRYPSKRAALVDWAPILIVLALLIWGVFFSSLPPRPD
jgi:hypothetical protein